MGVGYPFGLTVQPERLSVETSHPLPAAGTAHAVVAERSRNRLSCKCLAAPSYTPCGHCDRTAFV